MATGFGKEVRQHLKKAERTKVRQGGKASHEIWSGPSRSGIVVSVPIKIRSRHTANEILKAAGLGKRFWPASALSCILPEALAENDSMEHCRRTFGALGLRLLP